MADREKVIKKFADYVHYFKPYCIGDIEDHAMLKDVFELLKEQDKEIKEQEKTIKALEDKVVEMAKLLFHEELRKERVQYIKTVGNNKVPLKW